MCQKLLFTDSPCLRLFLWYESLLSFATIWCVLSWRVYDSKLVRHQIGPDGNLSHHIPWRSRGRQSRNVTVELREAWMTWSICELHVSILPNLDDKRNVYVVLVNTSGHPGYQPRHLIWGGIQHHNALDSCVWFFPPRAMQNRTTTQAARQTCHACRMVIYPMSCRETNHVDVTPAQMISNYNIWYG